MRLEAAILPRVARRFRPVSLYRYSGRSSVVLIAAVGVPAILASSIFARPRAKPPPGEIERERKYDPVKGQQQLVERGRTGLEPVDQGNRPQRHAPDDEHLPGSTAVDHFSVPAMWASASPVSRNVVQSSMGFAPIRL